jgi:hypothetical protein
MIIIAVSNLGVDVGKTSLRSQLSLTLEKTASQVIDFYSFSKENELKPNNDEEVILRSMKLDLPDKISNNKYSLKFDGNVLSIKSGEIEINRTLNINIDLEGEALPSAFLQLKRENSNNIIKDKIVLVD